MTRDEVRLLIAELRAGLNALGPDVEGDRKGTRLVRSMHADLTELEGWLT